MLGAVSFAGAVTTAAAVSIDKLGAVPPCSRLAKAIGAGAELVSAKVTGPAAGIRAVTSSETHAPASNGPEATVGLAEEEGVLSHVIVGSSQSLEATPTVTPFLSPPVA